MTTTVNIHEVKTHFSKLVKRAEMGEEIVIAKAGRPIARLAPLVDRKKRRVPGSARGQIWISEDFNDPLPEDILEAFEA